MEDILYHFIIKDLSKEKKEQSELKDSVVQHKYISRNVYEYISRKFVCRNKQTFIVLQQTIIVNSNNNLNKKLIHNEIPAFMK